MPLEKTVVPELFKEVHILKDPESSLYRKGCQVLMAIDSKTAVFFDVSSYSLANGYKTFCGNSFHLRSTCTLS
jgi:hypothetical protein